MVNCLTHGNGIEVNRGWEVGGKGWGEGLVEQNAQERGGAKVVSYK